MLSCSDHDVASPCGAVLESDCRSTRLPACIEAAAVGTCTRAANTSCFAFCKRTACTSSSARATASRPAAHVSSSRPGRTPARARCDASWPHHANYLAPVLSNHFTRVERLLTGQTDGNAFAEPDVDGSGFSGFAERVRRESNGSRYMKRRFRCIPQHSMRVSVGASNGSVYVQLTYNAAALKRGERIKSDGMAAGLLSSVRDHRLELHHALTRLEGRRQLELFLYFDGI